MTSVLAANNQPNLAPFKALKSFPAAQIQNPATQSPQTDMNDLPPPIDLNQLSHFNNPNRYFQQIISRAIELSSANNDTITGLVVARLYTDAKTNLELSEVLCAVMENRGNAMQHELFDSWVEGCGDQIKLERAYLIEEGDGGEGLVESVRKVLGVLDGVGQDGMDLREG